MSLYTDRKTYFEGLAAADPVIKHGVDGRVSFFTDATEEALLAGIINKCDPPFVWYEGPKGNMQDVAGGLNENITHTLRFYSKGVVNDSVIDKETAAENAYNESFLLVQHWMHRIIADGYNDADGGAFDNVDMGSVNYSKMPVFNDFFYGWQLQFIEVKIDMDFTIPEQNYWTV